MNRANLSLTPAWIRRSRFLIFSTLLLLWSQASIAQYMDSTDLPVFWLRADKCAVTDTAWKDVTGHGYNGSFYGASARRNVWLNFNPALWFNGSDDSVRIPYNLDSLSEMSYIAVFIPADTVEAVVWGTGGAVLRNTLMSTHRVSGPDSTADTLLTTPKMATLATVLQNWQRNDSIAPSASAYFIVGSGGVLPPFKGALAELLVFDRSLDVLTQVQYETYLAIKYGIPLTKGNYVSAGQAVLWDANKNKDYASRVTGLGRESYFSLHQKQAASAADADSLLVLSRGDIRATNAANSDTLADGHYLLWGDNNKSLGVTATPDAQLQLLNRGWLMSVNAGGTNGGGADSNALTTVRLNKKKFPASANGWWLVQNTGAYVGFPVDSLTYHLPDSVAGDSLVYYRKVRWDPDHSGKDLFGFAQGRDVLAKLRVLDSPSCASPLKGRAVLQAIGGVAPYYYRVIKSTGEVLASGVMADSTVRATLDGLAMGTYSVMLNDARGSQSLRSLSLTVDQAEALNIGLGPDQNLPTGGEIVFDASRNIAAGAAQTYQWQGDNGFNANTPSITVREPGVYTVTVTSTAGCVFRDTVSVDGDAKQHIAVYPSPSTDGNFTVSVSLPATGDISVGIYDLNGNKQQEMAGKQNTEYRLQGHLSTPGVYMITVKTPHGVESRKLLIL